MIRTAAVRLALFGVFLCAHLLRAQEARPIVFEVVLPASATLEIDGYMTKSTGVSRSFETPAVIPGKRYTYTIRATDGGKEVVKTLVFEPGGSLVFDLRPDFAAAGSRTTPMNTPRVKPKLDLKRGPTTPGFATFIVGGRLWVFRDGSTELGEFETAGDLEKHVTRINAGPKGVTIKAPDAATLDAYLKAQPK